MKPPATPARRRWFQFSPRWHWRPFSVRSCLQLCSAYEPGGFHHQCRCRWSCQVL